MIMIPYIGLQLYNIQIMSIAEEERQINQILTSSKNRLGDVKQKLEQLDNQKTSIDEDISILTQRVQVIRARLIKRKKALESINRLTSQSEDAFRKLKESTKFLLNTVKKQCKHVDDLLLSNNSDEEDEEVNEDD